MRIQNLIFEPKIVYRSKKFLNKYNCILNQNKHFLSPVCFDVPSVFVHGKPKNIERDSV